LLDDAGRPGQMKGANSDKSAALLDAPENTAPRNIG
jgi:hypothetical protein